VKSPRKKGSFKSIVKEFQRLALSLIPLLFPLWSQAGERFQKEVEQELLMTRRLPIYVLHRLGSIKVTGSVQDRIRVKLHYEMLAENRTEAEHEFGKLGLVSFETRNRFEVRVGHARGQDLVSKMKSRMMSPVRVDLEIRAPIQSDLTLIVGAGKALKVDQWKGGLTLAGQESEVDLSRLEMSRPLLLNCTRCPLTIRDSKVSGRVVVGSKPLHLIRVESPQELSIDQGSEQVRVSDGKGVLHVHSGSGRLLVESFEGSLQFQSEEGDAFLSQLNGAASVRTQTGQVLVDLDGLKGPLHVDTEKGDVQISLFSHYEGPLDLMSLKGDVIVQFPYSPRKQAGPRVYGPASPGRVEGQVGSRPGHLVHAYSRQGGVRILRKVPAK
jgi:hypothetical protein